MDQQHTYLNQSICLLFSIDALYFYLFNSLRYINYLQTLQNLVIAYNYMSTLRYPNCLATAQNCSFECCNYLGYCPTAYPQCYYFYDPNDLNVNVVSQLCKQLITPTKTYFKCKNTVSKVGGEGAYENWTDQIIINVVIGGAICLFAIVLLILLIVWYRKESNRGWIDSSLIKSQPLVRVNQDQTFYGNQNYGSFHESPFIVENRRLMPQNQPVYLQTYQHQGNQYGYQKMNRFEQQN